LSDNGFTTEEINALEAQGIFTGGPASAIEVTPVDNNLHFHFATRVGTPPSSWTIPDDHKHTVSSPIETGKWYDFILQIKYSQNNDGRFRIWMYEPVADSNYAVSDAPEWDFVGSTMYTYPTGYNKSIPSPEFRYGVYRYNAASANDITDQDRYMVKYAGPMRLWVGESDDGFENVKPR
jgi:hypothetical protein